MKLFYCCRSIIPLILAACAISGYAVAGQFVEVTAESPDLLPREEAFDVAYANALAKLNEQIHGSLVRNRSAVETTTIGNTVSENVNRRARKKIETYNVGYVKAELVLEEFSPSMSRSDIGKARVTLRAIIPDK